MTTRSGPRRRREPISLWLLAGVSAIIATAGLHAVFRSWTFLAISFAGALVAVAAGLLGKHYKLLLAESVALSTLLFVVVGIVVVGGAPTPSAARMFFGGLVDAWADIISATQPADLTKTLRAIPFALAWLGALVGCELARRSRTPSLPIFGPLVGLALTVLLSAEERTIALAQGTLLATAGLAMGVVQQRAVRRRSEVRPPRAGTPRGAEARARDWLRSMRVAVMLVVVALAAPFVGPRLPLAEANSRYDLRNQQTPPWDPLAVPSPLVELKASLIEGRRDDVVFTVQSDTPIERWQVAVLGDYDGIVWTVGSGGGVAASEFRPVDTRLPDAPGDVRNRTEVSATVTVTDLDEPWLPTPGWVTTLNPIGDFAPEVRANLRTGTLVVPAGIPPGLTYEVTAFAPPALPDAELVHNDATASPQSSDLQGIPPPVKNLAADVLEGQDLGWEQVVSVRDSFRATGFYDSTTNVPPGHSYFRLAEFLNDPDRIVGYEEQYAAAAAVILRAAQLPTRVVVGYRVPADRWVAGNTEVLASDVSAWVEVRLDDVGWIPADVTPDRTRTPTTDAQGTVFEDIAVPNPPPPPQLPPNVEVITGDEPEEAVEEPDDDDQLEITASASTGLGPARIILVAGAGLVLLLVLGGLAVVLAKRRRSRRRRDSGEPAERVAGAWLELSDRCREAGVPLADQATPLEAARTYLETEPSATAVRGDLLALVATVDRAAYHAEPPEDERAERAWRYSDRVADALVRDRNRRERVWMQLDPRPLRRRDPTTDQHRTSRR